MEIKPRVSFDELPDNAKEVLAQLFVTGPKWDGYVASKTGRDILQDFGLIERGFGWQWLTRDGMETAVAVPSQWVNYFEGRARKKASTSIG